MDFFTLNYVMTHLNDKNKRILDIFLILEQEVNIHNSGTGWWKKNPKNYNKIVNSLFNSHKTKLSSGIAVLNVA
jgi:hypothetical protein